ncbi:unnamed protein product [Porites lobata]|uniref:Harbinger transposase-derived nuclease n=1 Tax=Porites lobata TaxID=104759 RepID=A0ABN8RIN0_9CNID|nr:unnamed protein product [Porites lobata]
MAATLLPFPFRRRVTPFSGENSAETLNRFRRKRRRKIFKWSILLMAIIMSQCTIERTIWQLPRTGAWFQLALNEFSDQEWYENFRLSRATFRFLVEELKPELTLQDTKMRKAVEVEKKVALFLYFIASTASYRTLSNLFGLSRGFVCICIRKVAAAVLRKLKPKYMSIAKGDELTRVIANYKEKWGFPMCAGAIDGTHIPISTPQQNHASYINRKSYHSIVMQALVDSSYLFRDIVVGWPGSVHDARVFSNSQLYALGCSGRLFPPDVKEEILGQEIHPVILGDPAYPMLNWLLKGRFPRFSKRLDMEVDGAVEVVAAACVIHNICEMRKEPYFVEWLQEGFEQPEEEVIQDGPIDELPGSDVRDTLAAFFMSPEGQNLELE